MSQLELVVFGICVGSFLISAIFLGLPEFMAETFSHLAKEFRTRLTK